MAEEIEASIHIIISISIQPAEMAVHQENSGLSETLKHCIIKMLPSTTKQWRIHPEKPRMPRLKYPRIPPMLRVSMAISRTLN